MTMSSMGTAKVIVQPVHEVHVLLDIGENSSMESVLHDQGSGLSSVPDDLSLSCLKIVPEMEEYPLQPHVNLGGQCASSHSHQAARPQLQSNQDDVLSVVIQKLTELVENSDTTLKVSDKESLFAGSSTPKSDFEGTSEIPLEQPKSKGKCKLFKCPNCPCLFSVTKAQLRRKVHPVCPCCVKAKSAEQLQVSKPIKQTLIRCDLCNAIFSSYSDVLLHLGTHTNATIFKCRLCDFVTAQEKNILKHEIVHYIPTTHQKLFKCIQCNHTVSDFAELQNHLKMHNKNKELLMKCSDCGFTCQCEDTLRKHMWQHMQSMSKLSSNQNPQCALLKTAVPSSQDETNSDMLCRIKGSVCPMQDGWHSQVCLYKCPLCSYICEKLSTLKCHVWRHAGDKKCAYPLIDNVEGLKAGIPISNENNAEIGVSSTQQAQIVLGCCVDTGKTCCQKRNESACHCEAISVPKDQYPIIKNIIENPESISQSRSESVHSEGVTDESNHTIRIFENDIQNVSEIASPVDKPMQNNNCMTGDARPSMPSGTHTHPEILTLENGPIYKPDTTSIQVDVTSPAPDILLNLEGDIVTQNAEVVVSETVEIHLDNMTDTQQIEMTDQFVPLHQENKSDDFIASNLLNYKSDTSANSYQINTINVHKQTVPCKVDLNKSEILESLLINSQNMEKSATQIDEVKANTIEVSGSSTDEENELLSVREEVVQSSPGNFSVYENSPQGEKAGISKSLLCVIETLVQRSNKDGLSHSLKRKRKRHENDSPEFGKSSKKGFQCELCSYKTTSSGYMQRHMRYHIVNKPNQCPFCQFQAVDSQQLKTHMVKDCKKPIHSCKKCSAKFYYKSKLLGHMRTHATLFKCASCSFETNSENDVEEHRLVHPNVTAVDTAKRLCSTETSEESSISQFICQQCSVILSNQDDLDAHVKIHFKAYKCQLCDYSSATANGVKNHMKFHIKDRPHKCPLCEFSGAYPQSLRAHMKTHMQEYNFSLPAANEVFKCKLCGYTCSHLPSLKSHMWKHASDPHFNYECAMSHIKHGKNVPDVATQKNVLKTDAIPKLDETLIANEAEYVLLRYQCAQCGFVCASKDTLIAHIKAQHKQSFNLSVAEDDGKKQ